VSSQYGREGGPPHGLSARGPQPRSGHGVDRRTLRRCTTRDTVPVASFALRRAYGDGTSSVESSTAGLSSASAAAPCGEKSLSHRAAAQNNLPHHNLPHHNLPHHNLPHHTTPHHSRAPLSTGRGRRAGSKLQRGAAWRVSCVGGLAPGVAAGGHRSGSRSRPPPPLSYQVDTPRPSPRTNRTRRVPRSLRRGAR
jgi:hypothetical protein